MTTRHSEPAADAPPAAAPGPDGDPGDQDIDAAGTEVDPLTPAARARAPRPRESQSQGSPSVPSLTATLGAVLDREVDRTRRVLAQVPADRTTWKPHDRSMEFGYLSHMVATIPSWVAMIVKQDELDIAPVNGPAMPRDPLPTSQALLQALDVAAADARTALLGTTDDHLLTPWRLKAGGNVVQEAPRFQMIQDTLSHWAHHRGQMTVYLRLMDARVPAVYGPSADDPTFA